MRSPARLQSGFSLIELMIAVVIGMAAVIIMMQMLMNSDTAKRVTVGGNDAQIAGAIALFNLERDIRSAGFGIQAANLLGCPLRLKTGSGATVTVPLTPVTINDESLVPAGDANTDTLLLVHAGTGESVDGDPLVATSSDSTYTVATPATFRKGEQVVLQRADRPEIDCTVTLNTVRDVGSAGLAVDQGVPGFPVGSIVYNLGRLTVRAYAIRNGNLTVCDYTAHDCRNADVNDPDVWEPIASNIVALRAQYGRDLANLGTPRSGKVTAFTRTRPGAPGAADSAIPLQCAWARTVSLRIGLVARNTHYDKTLSPEARAKSGEPLPPPPTWSGARSPTAPSAVANQEPEDFDLSESIASPSSDDEWQRYRYKSFEISVPLRNMLLQGDDSC